MTLPSPQPISVFAPAKVNLYLHVTGKRKDGYHTLDSLAVFCDIGDTITIAAHPHFEFIAQGPYAKALPPADQITTTASQNLCVRAAKALSEITGEALQLKITLTKNLPVSSGLGAGSADAAATLYGLHRFWGRSEGAPLAPLLAYLGADVPACYRCEPVWMSGTGTDLTPAPPLPELSILLVNPLKPCATRDVFLGYNGAPRGALLRPPFFENTNAFLSFLRAQHNDLTPAAIPHVPEIANILTALEKTQDCLLARMSGSGATCFALYTTQQQAQATARRISADNPDWWTATGWINRSER